MSHLVAILLYLVAKLLLKVSPPVPARVLWLLGMGVELPN
jgi:hypothetical protein